MKVTTIDYPGRPAVAVVGSWDPLLPAHHDLVDELCAYGRAHDLIPLVIAIAPEPGIYLYGRAHWPVYNDPGTRWRALLATHPVALAHLRFTRADLFAVAVDFFRALDPVVELQELWLGASQSLGSGPEGGRGAIEAQCDARQIAVRWLPRAILTSGPARHALLTGRVLDASKLVGRPPVRRRPASRVIRLAWPAGRYQAVPLASPLDCPAAPPLTLDFVQGEGGLSRTYWPDDAIPYLAFVRGPGDEVGPVQPT